MADTKAIAYPDMAGTQWWNIRQLFRNKVPTAVTKDWLFTAIGMGDSNAKNIQRNLAMMGLVDKEEWKPTPRAFEWRFDEQYANICKQIREEIYPVELLDAWTSSHDRNILVNWFKRKSNIMDTAAKKNAKVFELLFEADPSQAPEQKPAKESKGKSATKPVAKAKKALASETAVATPPAMVPDTAPPSENGNKETTSQPIKPTIDGVMTPSVHIDIQIHISPEANAEQIDQIFSSIEKHLYQPRNLADERAS